MIDLYLLWILLYALGSYFIGNINWAVIISKFKNKDIRQMGSGNPGTLNMSRNFGLKLGLLTFFLDILKGALPTLISFFVFRGVKAFGSNFNLWELAMYLSGFSVVMGHIYPVFFKFKGGKGIASTIGVFLVCESVNGVGWAAVSVMALVAAAAFIYFTEFGAMGSFIAITPPAVASLIRLYMTYQSFTGDKVCIALHAITNILILATCFFTWFAHRQNIKRMLAGDEHPTSIKQMVVKMKAKKLAQKSQEGQESSQENK